VLGKPPNAPAHPVPGPAVGYAPQEFALHEDLSIRETLLFYSSLNQMSASDFKARKKYLLEMLDLPSEKRIIKTLSGGQQRRVSLAVALLHNPELLILDEPTVGVDPMLRSRIWDYLRDITQKTGVTVIITTHYIEEARGADRVGLMRHGKLLAEADPESLIKEYDATNLEDVFLQLCRAEHYTKGRHTSELPEVMEKGQSVVERRPPPQKNVNKFPSINEIEATNENDALLRPKSTKKSSNCCTKSMQHVFAIARRKLTQLLRNWRLFAFELLLPVFQVFLLLSAIGGDPHNLKIAVFNEDTGVPIFGMHLANEYLGYFSPNNTDMFDLINVTDFNTGYDMVKNAKTWGFLHFGPEFSTGLLSRINFPSNLTYINQSTIYTYLDMSNYQVVALILRQMQTSFESMSEEKLGSNMNPIDINSVYGSTNTNYVAFIAPGMIVMTTFAFAIGLTALAFVREKSDGCLDRIFSTGVKARSVIGGHFVTHSLVGVFQTIFLLIEVVYIFKIPVAGLVVYVFAMMLILQFAGMSLGLLISTASTSERDAVQLTLGSFFPVMIMSGILWPIEAIPKYLVWISKILPTMWAADAMRSVMIRGWGMEWQGVWQSFLITGAWALALVVLASFNLSEKESRWWWKLTRCCRKEKSN
jgi:ABC-type multidrug transport system ATPase subunit/ABC-type multidrug transport system permease subunit